MSTDTMPISDFDIEAYIDNELDWERAKTVLSHIEKDPYFKKRYDELRQQKQLLSAWWRDTQFN